MCRQLQPVHNLPCTTGLALHAPLDNLTPQASTANIQACEAISIFPHCHATLTRCCR